MKSNTVVLIAMIGSVICIVLAACVLCLVFGFVGTQMSGFDVGLPLQTGGLAPVFQLETTDGDQISLMDFRGQPVLLNFWALWCGPCLEEIPIIEDRFQAHYPDLIVLAVEEGESRNGLLDFVDDADITFRVLMGSDAVARRYGIHAYPTSFFIDADGVIRSIVVGSMTGSDLDAELAKIGIGD